MTPAADAGARGSFGRARARLSRRKPRRLTRRPSALGAARCTLSVRESPQSGKWSDAVHGVIRRDAVAGGGGGPRPAAKRCGRQRFNRRRPWPAPRRDPRGPPHARRRGRRPGIIHRTVDAMVERGEEPTRAALAGSRCSYSFQKVTCRRNSVGGAFG